MASSLNAAFLLLVLSLALICISLLPLASAGPLRRVARTRPAHDAYRRQRRLTDAIDRGSRPPLHMFETKAHFEEEKREKGDAGANGGDGSSSAPIKYLGGPVMTGSVNVYLIYYGNWPEGSGQDVIENFVNSLGAGSDQQGDPAEPTVDRWWAINAAYYQDGEGGRENVGSEVQVAGTAYDDYSAGTNFGENTVWEVVSSWIGDGQAFPYDPQGLYMLLTSPDVTVPGYCSEYCGWHTMDYMGSDAVIYSFVGHHGQCAEGCGAQSASPNEDPAIDATVSTIAHEIAEAASDPDASSGWLDDQREENADKCSYGVGATLTDSDSSGNTYEYNLVGMNGIRFLVQQNWDWENNMCVSQGN
ncbi:hypothetical protein CLOP_g17469 [Closterium sp. NIES-67]|nr:hypothetical protein CLOP_g11630 [Closterium sp. NIES-67]GJP60258.1 hypothetical protein CLOP_g17469 [Closterium sp. NIES-67]